MSADPEAHNETLKNQSGREAIVSDEELAHFAVKGGAAGGIRNGIDEAAAGLHNLTEQIRYIINRRDAFDINDPRSQMAGNLFKNGEASVDEILEASFGEWPPKGLDIDTANPQKVKFQNIVDTVPNRPADGILGHIKQRIENTGPGRIQQQFVHKYDGLAFTAGPRTVGINELRLSKLPGLGNTSALSTVMGHEGVHILQGDHYARAGGLFDMDTALNVLGEQDDITSRTIAKDLFNKHANMDYRSGLGTETVKRLDYLSDGVEIQARMHQTMMEGYQRWGQLPANREQLLVAMEDSGIRPPEEIMKELDNSPTINKTRAIFSKGAISREFSARTGAVNMSGSAMDVPHYVSELNYVQDSLTDAGKAKLWTDTMPEMYSDLIEMYGDKHGRERFGLGENKLRPMRQTAGHAPVALDTQKELIADNRWLRAWNEEGKISAFLDIDNLGADKTAMLESALKEQGVDYKIQKSPFNGQTNNVIAVEGNARTRIDLFQEEFYRTKSEAPVDKAMTASKAMAADSGHSFLRGLKGFKGGFLVDGALGLAAGAGAYMLTDSSLSESGELSIEIAVPYGEVATELAEGDTHGAVRAAMTETAGLSGALAGAGVGASYGATIGSVVPIAGTAIGATAGGIIGGIAGGVGLGMGTDYLLTKVPEIVNHVHDAAVYTMNSANDIGASISAKAGHLWNRITGHFNDAAEAESQIQIAPDKLRDILQNVSSFDASSHCPELQSLYAFRNNKELFDKQFQELKNSGGLTHSEFIKETESLEKDADSDHTEIPDNESKMPLINSPNVLGFS